MTRILISYFTLSIVLIACQNNSDSGKLESVDTKKVLNDSVNSDTLKEHESYGQIDTSALINDLKSNGVIEGYQPEEPINFPHSVHAEIGIDCRYCHNTVKESKEGSLVHNVCLNCHKPLEEGLKE